MFGLSLRNLHMDTSHHIDNESELAKLVEQYLEERESNLRHQKNKVSSSSFSSFKPVKSDLNGKENEHTSTSEETQNPPAPEDRCTQKEKFIAPTVLAGMVLVGLWFAFRGLQFATLRDPVRPLLQLTVWTHLAVGLFLLFMRKFSPYKASVLGITCVGLALCVMVGRIILMNVRPKSNGEVMRDLITHFIVPATIMFFFLTGYIPRVNQIERYNVAKKSCWYAFGFLALWVIVNLVFQYARNGHWVYGSIANPRTNPGRKQLASVAIATVVCVLFAAGLEFVRPKKAFQCVPQWPSSSFLPHTLTPSSVAP